MKLFQASSKYLDENRHVLADNWDEARKMLIEDGETNDGKYIDDNGDLVWVVEEEICGVTTETKDNCVLFEISLQKGVL